MNRRDFLNKLSTTIVAACVMVRIPTGILPKTIQKDAAGKFLVKCWNEYAKGRGMANLPREMYASKSLHEAFESNLQPMQRFVSCDDKGHVGIDHLAFKNLRLYKVEAWDGWQVKIGDQVWSI